MQLPADTRIFGAMKRSFGMVLLALAAAVSPMSGCAPERPPNIVLIVIDTLRADHLSHYGYGRPTAPALDGFAETATLFTDCTSPAPWTVPSVASVMTGLHPARHRLHRMGFALPEDLVTVAEVLRDGGWQTAAVSFNPYIRPDFGFDQGFDLFEDHRGKFGASPDVAEMVHWVDTWLTEDPPQPFFLYLQPMNVHGPYKVPKEARRVLLGRPPSRRFKYFGEPMRAIMRKGRLDLREQVDPAYVESLIDQYDTAVRYTTDQVARIFALLSSRGLFDNTLIILTADHGEELFDHGGFNHGTSMHRELLHVPLYVKMPGQREASQISTPVSLLDLFPTILDVAGLQSRPHVDGRSMLPVLDDPSSAAGLDPRSLVYQCKWQKHFVGSAISSGRFKLVKIISNYERTSHGWRLYDVRSDPGEHIDLAENQSEVLERLRREMDRAISQNEEPQGPKPEDRRHLLATDHERLRALGYVE